MTSSPSCVLMMFSLFLCLGILAPQADARAFFIFGDSLVDSGNNNYLTTFARADAFPYGIDYPTHQPTGRFSNGFNIPDIISEYIGSEAPLPYLSLELNGLNLVNGANFASAGVGILNDTGSQFFDIIRVPQQLEYFREYQQRVRALLGPQLTKRLVNEGLFLVTLGGNDFINNYFLMPNSTRSRQFSLPTYVCFLIYEYRKILMRLHYLGAYRVLVTGTGALGCAPGERATHSKHGECSTELQRAASLFNPQLIRMIKGLNNKIGRDVFVAVNTHQMHNDFLNNPGAYGFDTSKIACCGQGSYNGLGVCRADSNLCPDRDLYVYWDAFHPSQKANRFIVQRIMTGTIEYMNPMNLSTIIALDSKT